MIGCQTFEQEITKQYNLVTLGCWDGNCTSGISDYPSTNSRHNVEYGFLYPYKCKKKPVYTYTLLMATDQKQQKS